MENSSENPKQPKKKGGRPKGKKDSRPRAPFIAKENTKAEKKVSKKCSLVPTDPGYKEFPMRYRLFAAEYLKHGNATEAAIAAGYTEKRARARGAIILARKDVQKVIEDGLRAKEIRTAVTADRIISEIANIAFSTPTAIMTWGPGGLILKDSETLGPNDLALVSEVSETKANEKGGGGSLKVKLNDKMKALEMLAKMQGLLIDKVSASVQTQDMGKPNQEAKEAFQDAVSAARAKWESRQIEAQ